MTKTGQTWITFLLVINATVVSLSKLLLRSSLCKMEYLGSTARSVFGLVTPIVHLEVGRLETKEKLTN